MFVGFPLAVLFVSLAGSSLFLIGLPIYYRWTDWSIGSWHVDSLQRAVLLMPVGALGALLTLTLIAPVAAGGACLRRAS